MPNIKRDILKGVAYTAISQKKMVENGWSSYDHAKTIVDRWVNGCEYSIKEYFSKEIYTVDRDSNQGKEFAEDAWEALEYFNII